MSGRRPFKRYNNSGGFYNSNRGGYGGNGRFHRGGSRGGRDWQGDRGHGGFRGGRNQNYTRNDNQHWKNRPKREMPSKRLSEEEIGVTQYISDHEGFLGVIKSRYSDFQVSEINEQGEMAVLTDLSPPPPPAEEAVVEDEDLLLCKYNVEILPMDTWDNINKLAVSEPSEERVEDKSDLSDDFSGTESNYTPPPNYVVDVTGMTKEQRTKIHDAVKKAFGDIIVGSTVTVDEKKLVRFEKYRKGVRIDNRVKWLWPGEYVHFVVYKENCDTMDAAVRIAERLRVNIKPSMLGYAGTKDRRAKTSQWFSVRKLDPRKMAAACRQLRDVWVGNYVFRSAHLKLGMLKGNRFRIALRNVKVEDEVIKAACSNLQERGFLNYYGLQRFGSRVETPTYHVGLKLLQGNFKQAIDLILEAREGPIEHALRVYASSGAPAALQVFPRRAPHSSIELRLLDALSKYPSDLLGAMNKLARNTRLLYLHSYQSLVWNRCVSERVRRFGLDPAAGDLVPLSQVHNEEEIVEGSDHEDNDEETESNQDGGDLEQDGDDVEQDGENEAQDGADADKKMAIDKLESSEPKKTNEKSQNTLETSKKEKQKVPVKVLSQEDVDSGKYTLFDVVLPLPGYNIEYPPNMKEYYEELLTKDGLTLEMKHKFKSYSMSGAYRHAVVRPIGVEWSCVRYSDPFADLLASDLDQLEGREMTGILEDGKYKALLLTMTLPASCYATMALRELLKVDTSCDNQALQNNYHKEKKEVKKDEVVQKEVGKNEASNEPTQNEDVSKDVAKMEVEDKSGNVKRKLESEEVVGKKVKQEE